MKKIIVAALCATGAATSANATVTVSETPGNATYAGPTPTYTFSSASRPVTTGGTYYGESNDSDARPYGGTDGFYSVSPDDAPGTLSLTGFGAISSLSFIWGSVDPSNTLSFLDSLGNTLYTITGQQLMGAAATGDKTSPVTNPLVSFTFTGADRNVAAMSMTTSNYSFEIDNLAISPVPEPATWGMMMLGVGIAGGSLRRRRVAQRRAAVA